MREESFCGSMKLFHEVLTSPAIDRNYTRGSCYCKSSPHHSRRDDEHSRTEEERDADLSELGDPQLPQDRYWDGHNEAVGEDVQDYEDPEVLGAERAAVAR